MDERRRFALERFDSPHHCSHVAQLFSLGHIRTMSDSKPITKEEFEQMTRCLVGLPITRPWRGGGSALFLELGSLADTGASRGKPKGEATVMIEWSWRVESPRAIVFGSWCGVRKIDRGIQNLAGLNIEDISLVGRLPEIMIQLSGGRWIQSFMTADGQPVWTLFLLDGGLLYVERGCVFRGRRKQRV